ncbi:hypothetical protein [Noviherbaspirillum malthae]|uniref:hypothetical protein n=1 Tax=Noviherbaspirillum malthae TaxID=1260987 RepID=UPI00188E2712|nr:hypothetical protein [Noviherbaspirillum malthae]
MPLDADAAFRYERFARRIVAAQYGEPESMIWAYEWLEELITSARAMMLAEVQRRQQDAATAEKQRQEYLAGRVGNAYYQAFLDTVEDPSTVSSNIAYFAWHAERSREYERLHPKALREKQTDFQPSFGQYLRQFADSHLSERVKQERAGNTSS